MRFSEHILDTILNWTELTLHWSELGSCVKVEVAVLVSRPYGFSGRKVTLHSNSKHWFTTSFLQPLPYLVMP